MRLECDSPWHARRARALLRRLPPLEGRPIRVKAVRGLCDRHGPVHAASFVPLRRIRLSCGAADFGRILAHELFHFVWVRLGNPRRWGWEKVLRRERARGELGWSAEWRKNALRPRDAARRTRRWREYCCESFCDTAAWIYGGGGAHPEVTLAAKARRARRAWFAAALGRGRLSI